MSECLLSASLCSAPDYSAQSGLTPSVRCCKGATDVPKHRRAGTDDLTGYCPTLAAKVWAETAMLSCAEGNGRSNMWQITRLLAGTKCKFATAYNHLHELASAV